MPKLQNEKAEDWTFLDLYEGCQSLNNLTEAVKKYRPASNFSANFDGNSRQFEAIKGTIRSSMIRLEPLVRAWGTRTPERMFSISGWLEEQGGQKPTLILKYDPLYKESMGPFVANFLNFLFASILSLDDATGKNKDRRIWAVLDEFQILPKVPNLFEAARAGRSKGLRLLLGTQDLGQIDHMYKREGSRDTLINLIGFKLIGHLGSQGMQEFASGLLSKNKVLRREKSVQHGGIQLSTSYSDSEKTESTVSPADFGAIPIPTAYNGALFWLVHQGWHPVKLRYLTKNIPNKYPSKVDEPWLLDKDRNTIQDKAVIEKREVSPSRREVSGATKSASVPKKKFVGIDPNFSLDDS